MKNKFNIGDKVYLYDINRKDISKIVYTVDDRYSDPNRNTYKYIIYDDDCTDFCFASFVEKRLIKCEDYDRQEMLNKVAKEDPEALGDLLVQSAEQAVAYTKGELELEEKRVSSEFYHVLCTEDCVQTTKSFETRADLGEFLIENACKTEEEFRVDLIFRGDILKLGRGF